MGHIDNYYPASGRVIHVDMNAFTVRYTKRRSRSFTGEAHSCRRRHRARKGVIVTCSYAARSLGIRTGMNVRQAARIYPDLMIIQPDFHLYRKYSNAFMNIAYAYTPRWKRLRLTNVTWTSRDRSSSAPLDIAREIQARIREELSAPCSVGIAPNKLLAKMASDMKKPNGLSVFADTGCPAGALEQTLCRAVRHREQDSR